MIFIDKKIDPNRDELCLNCYHMRPDNGYCPIVGDYVNAFWSCRQSSNSANENIPIKRTPRERHPSKRKGIAYTANRTEKKCSRCGIVKPIEKFVREVSRADGHGCYCLECNAIRRREAKLRKKLLTQ